MVRPHPNVSYSDARTARVAYRLAQDQKSQRRAACSVVLATCDRASATTTGACVLLKVRAEAEVMPAMTARPTSAATPGCTTYPGKHGHPPCRLIALTRCVRKAHRSPPLRTSMMYMLATNVSGADLLLVLMRCFTSSGVAALSALASDNTHSLHALTSPTLRQETSSGRSCCCYLQISHAQMQARNLSGRVLA